MIMPESWAVILNVFAPVFARRGTFKMFRVLATGMVAQTGRRSVVGMLAGAGMARRLSFHAACRFFSAAVWNVDRLGLAAAGFIVTHLLDPAAPIVVAVDDTLFRRWGRKTFISSSASDHGVDLRGHVEDSVLDVTAWSVADGRMPEREGAPAAAGCW